MFDLPKWDHWHQMPQAKLWQCVALTCEIEPRKTDASNLGQYGIHATEAKRGPSYSYDRRAIENYQSRIDIASAHLSQSGLLQPVGELHGQPRECLVSLPVFVRWAVSMDWKMPEELRAMATSPTPELESRDRQPADFNLRLENLSRQEAHAEAPSETETSQQSARPHETGRIHILRTRANILDAVIDSAAKGATDSNDHQSVWAELVRMAEMKDPVAPLIGYSSDGIQYRGTEHQRTGTPDVLTKKAFGARMKRRRRGNAH